MKQKVKTLTINFTNEVIGNVYRHPLTERYIHIEITFRDVPLLEKEMDDIIDMLNDQEEDYVSLIRSDGYYQDFTLETFVNSDKDSADTYLSIVAFMFRAVDFISKQINLKVDSQKRKEV